MKNQIIDFVFFGLLMISPTFVLLNLWGWLRWWRGRARRTRGELVSFAGLLLSTASALLGALIYLHRTPEIAPLETDAIFWFLKRLGMLTALAGIPFSIAGVGWPGPIRWPALAASLLAPFFWVGVGWDR